MKYERITERLYGGETVSVNGKVYYDEVADIVERLAELEDKIENGALIEKAELEKALAEKQDKGQDLTVKTIFKYNREIKNLKAEIEDKIENGTLIELPCKVGGKLYEVIKGMPIQVWEVEEIRFAKRSLHNFVLEVRRQDGAYWRFWEQDIGVQLFPTRAEAEKKLKGLKGE